MELKPWNNWVICTPILYQSNLYGIETVLRMAECTWRSVYQSNLYGIETSSGKRVSCSERGINRTFMELKPAKRCASVRPILGINRTFMELKHITRRATKIASKSINRTFMELKLGRYSEWSETHKRINRTFMELKHVNIMDVTSNVTVSIEPLWNWNAYPVVSHVCTQRVSIEPLWNWNRNTESIFRMIASYQSNLYGIETCLRSHDRPTGETVSIEPLWNWNQQFTLFVVGLHRYQSNLYGIETQQRAAYSGTLDQYQSNLYGIETRGRSGGVPCAVRINRTFMELKPPKTHRFSASSKCINRTFMELKPSSRDVSMYTYGSINRTFMELKHMLSFLVHTSLTCINRTFMELKREFGGCPLAGDLYQSNLYGIETNAEIYGGALLIGINRTFMELKLGKYMLVFSWYIVSIEPLWNWNARGCRAYNWSSCINRTFMELKRQNRQTGTLLLHVSIEPLWNWNANALSKRDLTYQVSIEPLWNWNSAHRPSRTHRSAVSIEPLWNWNWQTTGETDRQKRYQSNLYGIETPPIRLFRTGRLGINRTFMELKHCQTQRHERRKPVSIEPLWNWNRVDCCQLSRRAFVSIEPLWNWNIIAANITMERAAVSIEPLWNWNNINTPQHGKEGCINRTFMELKLLLSSRRCCYCSYQSNLYGIETRSASSILLFFSVSIEPLWTWNSGTPSNRPTAKIVSIEPLWNWNQEQPPVCGLYCFVSIEPLWNWNVRPRGSCGAWGQYQSNLYGIETGASVLNETVKIVSIEPLYAHPRAPGDTLSPYQSNLYGIETMLGVSVERVTLGYQSNLYGIETSAARTIVPPPSCINRTFMELKRDPAPCSFVRLIVSIEPLWNWNKPLQSIVRSCPPVSIEPLWNWNVVLPVGHCCRALYQSNLYGIETGVHPWRQSVDDRINRTFMELKRCWHDGSTCGRLGINRTFMELKQGYQYLWYSLSLSINRTFMELKRRWG